MLHKIFFLKLLFPTMESKKKKKKTYSEFVIFCLHNWYLYSMHLVDFELTISPFIYHYTLSLFWTINSLLLSLLFEFKNNNYTTMKWS